MDTLLIAREQVIFYYKRYETAIRFIAKFMLGLLVFCVINDIGCYHEAFKPLFTAPLNLPFLMLLSLLFTVLPPTLANLLVGLHVCLQISRSVEITFFVFLLFVLITVFYTRLFPRRGYLILALVLGFHFNLQYAVLLFAGLYCGLASVIPVTAGVFIWSFIPGVGVLLNRPAAGPSAIEELDIMGLFTDFLDTYRALFEMVTGDAQWIFTAFIFAMVIVSVYAVAKLTVDYAKDIALGVGALVAIFGFMIGDMIAAVNYSIVGVLFLSVLAALLMEAVKFFGGVLDYKKAERVQFEDDENYYYVKIIPKMIAAPTMRPALQQHQPPRERPDAFPPREKPLYRPKTEAPAPASTATATAFERLASEKTRLSADARARDLEKQAAAIAARKREEPEDGFEVPAFLRNKGIDD